MPASWAAPAAKLSMRAHSSPTGWSLAPSPASTPSTTSSRSRAPWSQARPLVMPARGFLVGVGQPQEPRLVERSSHRLKCQRETRLREATRHREGGQPIAVEGAGQTGEPSRARVEGFRGLRLEGREGGRRLRSDRRQKHVDFIEDVPDEGAGELRAEALRLEIIVGGDGEPDLEA